MSFPVASPAPPEWRVRWSEVDEDTPWIRAMTECPQDPKHHAEGDVWTHTKMVCDELVSSPGWRELPESEREVVFRAALLHDVGKPARTRLEADGSVVSPGHSWVGPILARRILWEADVSAIEREAVCGLVRYHALPYFLLGREDPRHLAITASHTARCDHLALLAEADTRGRTGARVGAMLEDIALFREFCGEQGCLSAPWRFPSAHSRFLYFRSGGRRDPSYNAHDDTRFEVVLMSGLPGAGKDHWIRSHLPHWSVVSLDDLRHEDAKHAISVARETARQHMRSGTDFIWNATNLSRRIRGSCIDLFADYNARIRIVAVEASPSVLRDQNQGRPVPVPSVAISRMLRRWEYPDLTEAHKLDVIECCDQ